MFDAERIRRAREEADLTQQELAERLGKSKDTVRGYETGRIEPPGKIVRQIADITGWRPEWFVGGVEIDRGPRPIGKTRVARSYDPDEPPVPGGLQRLIDLGLPVRHDELQRLVGYADPTNATRGARGAVGWTPGQWLDVLVEERRRRSLDQTD
jgi:transcriptional regulator with XRE-family HTH domain